MIRLGGGMKVRGSQGWPAADDNTRPGLAALSQGLAGRFAPGRKNVVSGGSALGAVWDADVSSLLD
jgi:hypothetical protein